LPDRKPNAIEKSITNAIDDSIANPNDHSSTCD
jgi:hypothetical protein